MPIPSLRNVEVDGQLRQSTRPSALVCVIGASSAGTPLQIGLDGRVSAITASAGYGPMPELAAQIASTGKPVGYVKVPSTVGALSSVTHAGTGAVLSVDADAANDAWDLIVRVAKAGVVGTPGAKLEVSYNGGYNFTPASTLGASDTLDLPGTGISIEFAAGNLVLGETYAFSIAPPDWDIADVLLALEKIKRSKIPFDLIALAGAASPSDLLSFNTAIAGMKPYGKHLWGAAEVRMPNAGETDAAYGAAINLQYAGVTTTLFATAAFAGRVPSAISGIVQRRTPLYGSINDLAVESISENAAAINDHAANALLTDELGNLIEHDANYDEILSDRFLVYRTWPGQDGVYLTWARLMSTPASSFQLIVHRRIVNRAEQACDAYFATQVHLPLLAKPDGTIAEIDAVRIQSGLLAAMKDALSGHVSAIDYIVDRTTNILTTSRLEGDLSVQPFGYPDTIVTRIILVAQVQAA